MIRSSKGLLALSPLLVFLLVYVLSSLFVGDFGRVPVSSAFLIAAIWAVATTPGKLRERINCFSKGAGDRNILLMIWIFVLAGAFAGSAKDIGAIDATVAATLHLVPSKLIFCGLFLASCSNPADAILRLASLTSAGASRQRTVRRTSWSLRLTIW